MTPHVDLSDLDLRSALDFAIAIEEDAELRYRRLSGMVKDPAVAAFLREMAHNEGEHRRQLEARGHVRFRHDPARLDVSFADDLDAPEDGEVSDAVDVHGAMEAALRAEHRAHEFYRNAIPAVRDPDVRAFFEELSEEEAHHEDLLRERIAALEASSPAR